MNDQTKQAAQFDPQSQSGPSPQQGSNPQEDKELTDFLVKEHGHTQQSAEHEVKTDREGVKKKKKDHEAQHGKSR